MTPYELYTFILCLFVFILLTTVFTVMLAYIVRLILRLIRNGAEDEKIRKEFTSARKKSHFWDAVSMIFSSLVCIAMVVLLMFSVCIGNSEESLAEKTLSLKVVKSESMATMHKENTYLDMNGLNDQIQMFDLIVTHRLPAEEDLQLYDIVIYEINGTLIVHRIIGIEEPNEAHPNERHFLLKGDGNEYADRFPVLYSQMRAIYQGERVPFVGSFITFMQSPAGWLCILLIVFATVATPLIEKKIENEKKKRWAMISVPASVARCANGGSSVGKGTPRTVGLSGGRWSFTFFFLQIKYPMGCCKPSDRVCDRSQKRSLPPYNRRK